MPPRDAIPAPPLTRLTWSQFKTLCTPERNPLYSRREPPVLPDKIPRTFRPKMSVPFRHRGICLFKMRSVPFAEEVCTFVRDRSVPFIGRGLYFFEKVQTSLCPKYGGFRRRVQGVWAQSTGGSSESPGGYPPPPYFTVTSQLAAGFLHVATP